jgi:FMN phosphatase YigB (HAD superfamily)/phosphohistidine swiveling domain-containing protein
VTPVSFDLWDTLLWHPGGPHPARDDRIALVARLTGRPPADVAEALSTARLPVDQEEPHDLTVAAQLRRALSRLRVPSAVLTEAADGIARLASRYPPVPVPGLRRALARLVRHERLAIVSNTRWTDGAELEGFLADEGLAGHFASIAFSDQTGWAKPAAGAFAAAWSRLDVDPRATVHVGDRADRDVDGARRAGAGAVVCRAVSVARQEGDRHADGIFYDYAGLHALLAYASGHAPDWELVAEGDPGVGPPVVARASFLDGVPEPRAGRIAVLGDGATPPEGSLARAAAVITTNASGSRAARMAVQAGIPCVPRADGLQLRVLEGDLLLVDGATGRIHASSDRRA